MTKAKTNAIRNAGQKTPGGVATGIQRQGMLGAAPESLRVIRIQRDGLVNRVKELDKSQAKELNADPVMKFTSDLQLQNLCNAIGLWIVPVGELEGFCRSEGKKGPSWVQNVLKKYDLRRAEELEEARAFVRRVWNRISP